MARLENNIVITLDPDAADRLAELGNQLNEVTEKLGELIKLVNSGIVDKYAVTLKEGWFVNGSKAAYVVGVDIATSDPYQDDPVNYET